MKRLLYTLAALVAASACTAAAHPSATAALRSSDVSCAIEMTRTRHGVRFEALAHGLDPASGQYEFVLTKDDADGSSDIVQSGAFGLAAGEQFLLGSSELSLEPGGRFRARLVLWDGAGDLCRAERRS